MSAWMSINDIKTDVLYGLLIGKAFVDRITQEQGKDWDLWFYSSERGRRQGIFYHKRHYPGSEFLTFEIKVIDLLKQSRLATVIPKEIHINDVALKYTRKVC